ncbi:hypothetical protein CHELA20_53177 [Hyphomicrobiales bacterium]|nr:hypothetical protein CHELA41_21748 [Hyphomicrobiales bacterium]CAH1683728.1 hypothetical protein CHELA20_53177 [Hyphomicrobiales bacterium]
MIILRRGGALRPNSVINFFISVYHALGLVGCSSHSRQRSLIIQAARKLHHAAVRHAAGHRWNEP